jgi:hypothetical protein
MFILRERGDAGQRQDRNSGENKKGAGGEVGRRGFDTTRRAKTEEMLGRDQEARGPNASRYEKKKTIGN